MDTSPSVSEAFGSMSVIIPAYNAPDEVVATIHAVRAWLDAEQIEYEIIVSDDGSVDDTAARAGALPGVRVLRSERNRGKGDAVRRGMLEARCAWALFMDVDNSTTIDHIARCAPIAESADVIIGSRRLEGANIVRRQPFMRRVLGDAFPAVVRMLALPGVTDTQCGFKVFRRNAVDALFSRQRVDRFAFDVELLLIARSLGLRTREVPVEWDNPVDSTVRVRIDTIQMMWDVLKSTARWRWRRTADSAPR